MHVVRQSSSRGDADAKYCSAACRQRAYVKRDGRGSNERPLDSTFIEQAIEAVFAAEPENAFTTAELCERILPDRHDIDKKHRVAVLAAAKRIVGRQPGHGWTGSVVTHDNDSFSNERGRGLGKPSVG